MLGIITYLTGRLVSSIKSSLPRPHPVGADNTTHHSRKADSLPFAAFGIIWKWQMQQCYNWASNFFNTSSSPNSFTNKLFLVPQFYLRRGRGRFLWNAKPLKKGEKKGRRWLRARSFDFEITRMISAQIALHSVQLPLWIVVEVEVVEQNQW